VVYAAKAQRPSGARVSLVVGILPSAPPRPRLRGRARPEPLHHHRRPRAHRVGALHARRAGRGAGSAREGLRGGGAGHGREPAAHDPAPSPAQHLLVHHRDVRSPRPSCRRPPGPSSAWARGAPIPP